MTYFYTLGHKTLNYYTHLTTSFLGQTGLASIKKAEPFWILIKQMMTGWHWHQLDHMQIICTLLLTHSIFMGRMLLLPPSQHVLKGWH